MQWGGSAMSGLLLPWPPATPHQASLTCLPTAYAAPPPRTTLPAARALPACRSGRMLCMI